MLLILTGVKPTNYFSESYSYLLTRMIPVVRMKLFNYLGESDNITG